MWVDTMFPTPIKNISGFDLHNDLSDTDLDYWILSGQQASVIG